MRIKLSVNNPEGLKNFNIQNVEICNEYNDKYYAGLPKIFFEVHKKFEKDLWGKSVVFHDKFGKELFKCNNIRIEWRFYEMYGSSRKDKVQFSATNLEFENLGSISHHYLSKILGKCCNVKYVEPPPKSMVLPPIRHKRRYRYMRAWAAVMAVGRYCILYRFMKTFRYVFKTIHNKLVTIRPQSTAPT